MGVHTSFTTPRVADTTKIHCEGFLSLYCHIDTQDEAHTGSLRQTLSIQYTSDDGGGGDG